LTVEVESNDESVLVATAAASGAVVATTNSIAVVALLLVGGVAACSISVLVVLSHTVNVDASGILFTVAASGIGAVVEVATVISWVTDVGAPTLGCFSLNPSGLLLKRRDPMYIEAAVGCDEAACVTTCVAGAAVWDGSPALLRRLRATLVVVARMLVVVARCDVAATIFPLPKTIFDLPDSVCGLDVL